MKKPAKKESKHTDAAEDKKMIDKAIKSYGKKDKMQDKKMMTSCDKGKSKGK